MTFMTAPLSFQFADTLPSHSWEPPKMALLQLDDMEPEPMAELHIGRMESAWAPTVHLGL